MTMASNSGACFMCFNNNDITIELSIAAQADLFDKFVKYLLPDYVVPDSKNPLYICTSCKDSMNAFYKFKKMCMMVNSVRTCTPFEHTDYTDFGQFLKIHIKNETENKLIHSIKTEEIIQLEIPQDEWEEISHNLTKELNEIKTTTKTVPTVLKKENGDVKKHECQICFKLFKYKYLLNKHMKVHIGLKENPFSMKKSNLANLKKTNDSKFFQCTFCHKKFMVKANLRQHMVCHIGIKKFRCSFCTMAFPRKKNWRDHEKIHKGEKDFECFLCGKRFIQNHSLTRHLRVHKKNECPICHMTFIYKWELTRHLKIHMGNSEV